MQWETQDEMFAELSSFSFKGSTVRVRGSHKHSQESVTLVSHSYRACDLLEKEVICQSRANVTILLTLWFWPLHSCRYVMESQKIQTIKLHLRILKNWVNYFQPISHILMAAFVRLFKLTTAVSSSCRDVPLYWTEIDSCLWSVFLRHGGSLSTIWFCALKTLILDEIIHRDWFNTRLVAVILNIVQSCHSCIHTFEQNVWIQDH